MKKLLIAVALVVSFAAPAMAEQPPLWSQYLSPGKSKSSQWGFFANMGLRGSPTSLQ